MDGIDEPLRHKAEKLERLRKQPPAPEFAEMSLEDLADVLSLTIRHDFENKLVTFLCMLSAYTHESQINVSFNAPSSSGKTYMTREIAKLFPETDLIELSGASPTSFYHGEGEFNAKRKAKIVSLSRKILIFYEQPDPTLQAKLRSVMSHDAWETKYRITNKGAKGQHKAELIIMQGYPATVFCSAGMRLDEQEATRAILLSPEVSEEKLKDGVHLQALRGSDKRTFKTEIDSDPRRRALKRRIEAIREMDVFDIIIPEPDYIEGRFHEKLTSIKPRHMRDMDHLQKLIKAIALLNVWNRRNNDRFEVSEKDVDQAFMLWDYFIESQNLNIPPAVLNFYKKYILPAYKEKETDTDFIELVAKGEVGLSRQELGRYYFKVEHMSMNDEQVRKQILPMLENSGVIWQQAPTAEGVDRRSRHIFPQYESKGNNIGQGGGTPKDIEGIVDPFDH